MNWDVQMKNNQAGSSKNIIISSALIVFALGLTYAPLQSTSKTITIVSGSELKEPLEAIEAKFE